MTKPRVLVMCRADPNVCPRPRRVIRTLSPHFDVVVLGTATFASPSIDSWTLPPLPVHSVSSGTRVTRLLLRRYRALLWSRELFDLRDSLKRAAFDLIVCHDVDLLPLAVSSSDGGRILFDAREYYPRHFEDSLKWRVLYQPLNTFLCRTYLSRCHAVMTVSPGIADAYRIHYAVDPIVVESVPPFHNLAPTPSASDRVRIVHHGNATPQRRIEGMIQVMDHVSDRFRLDLFLVPTDRPYYDYLIGEASRRRGVQVLGPVPYEQLIPRTNSYDIGMVFCPPTTFNIRFGLPNKLFEFIQARLAVAIGPSTDMKTVIDRHGCGICADDFEPATMAALLERTSTEQIVALKKRAHQAAALLNAEAQSDKITNLARTLIEGKYEKA